MFVLAVVKNSNSRDHQSIRFRWPVTRCVHRIELRDGFLDPLSLRDLKQKKKLDVVWEHSLETTNSHAMAAHQILCLKFLVTAGMS